MSPCRLNFTRKLSCICSHGHARGHSQQCACRLTVVAAGAAAGKFLHYEKAAPAVAAQTAYGIEAEIEGYEDNYDAESMLFMDFRRHHTGLWPDTAARCSSAQSPSGSFENICLLLVQSFWIGQLQPWTLH